MKNQIKTKQLSARKDKDKEVTDMLSLLLSKIQNEEIKLGRDLNEKEIGKIASKDIKDYNELIEKGKLTDEQKKEPQRMISILEKYVFVSMTEQETKEIMLNLGVNKDMPMGEIMNLTMGSEYADKLDGKTVKLLALEARDGKWN